jgi:hypothetical protein
LRAKRSSMAENITVVNADGVDHHVGFFRQRLNLPSVYRL